MDKEGKLTIIYEKSVPGEPQVDKIDISIKVNLSAKNDGENKEEGPYNYTDIDRKSLIEKMEGKFESGHIKVLLWSLKKSIKSIR